MFSLHHSPYAQMNLLREMEDYKEGMMETDDNVVFMGKHQNNRFTHFNKSQLLDSYKTEQNQGKVLWPEARKENWSYEKNQAFWAGAIEAGKTFKLVTPVDYYVNSKFVAGTIDEMMWLLDNHYKADVNRDGSVVFTPTRPVESAKIYQYNNGHGPHNDKDSIKQAMLERLKRAFPQSIQAVQPPRNPTSHYQVLGPVRTNAMRGAARQTVKAPNGRW